MERNRLQGNGKCSTRACSLTGHPTGRKLMAALAIAAGSSAAFAGGEECRPRRTAGAANASNVDALSAKSTGPLSAVRATGGYCPGGLSDQEDGTGSADDGSKSAQDLDAVDAAMIAKAQFPDVNAWVRAVKLEPGKIDGEVTTEAYWEIDLICGGDPWCVALLAESHAITIKYTGGAKAISESEDEQLEARTAPIPKNHNGTLGHAKPNCGVEAVPVKEAPDVVKADAMDMFEAIELVSEELDQRSPPAPVPTVKFTYRPHPKGKNSTGSRW